MTPGRHDHGRTHVAQESYAAGSRLPSRLVADSAGLGWRHVLARLYEDPPEAEHVTTAATPDLLLVLHVRGTIAIESRQAHGWIRATYTPGALGVTAPLATPTLRWRAASADRPVSLHVHLARDVLRAAAASVGRADPVDRLPDALLIDDPVIAMMTRALGEAVIDEAEPARADAIAHALGLHLVHGRLTRPTSPPSYAPRGALTAEALERVTAYMHAHRHEEIHLDDLARVAAISRHHFLRLFTRATGETPFRFLTRLRMERAAVLLRTTSDSVQEIAAECGYRSARQFANAFRRRFGLAPTAYRAQVGDGPAVRAQSTLGPSRSAKPMRS